MRKLVYGLAAAAAIAVSTPALAQVGFYVGPGGAGVEFGQPYGYYYGDGYYRWGRPYAYDHRYGWHQRYYRGDRWDRGWW